jgi:hypothetical protein
MEELPGSQPKALIANSAQIEVEPWPVAPPLERRIGARPSASWLNAVEGFFAKLTKQRLARGVFRSVEELKDAIGRFLAENNQDPRPFQWTKKPNENLAAVKRGHQVLDSIHSYVRRFKLQA